MTLNEMEEIVRFNQENDLLQGYGDFRGNIVTQGVRLNELVKDTFSTGEVMLKGAG